MIMSIATEIQRLQEAKADIKAAIEEKGVEVGDGLIDGYADKIDDVHEKGKQAGIEDFWDKYQDNGNRTDYGYAFAGDGWTDEMYNPKYPIVINPPSVTNRLTSLFQNSRVTATKQPIIIQTSATNNTPFYACQSLVEITELRLDTDMGTVSGSFNGCTKLKTIKITGSGKFLGTVTFKNSQNLTKESIISIIDALSPDVTGQTLTLPKVAVNREFGINVDDVSTWGEGSDYRKLVDTKPNWTITHG